jgi:hypothetical protein
MCSIKTRTQSHNKIVNFLQIIEFGVFYKMFQPTYPSSGNNGVWKMQEINNINYYKRKLGFIFYTGVKLGRSYSGMNVDSVCLRIQC